MPDIKHVLQDEIKRLAKHEIKITVVPLQKTVSELKRKVAELERSLAKSEKKVCAVSAETPAAEAVVAGQGKKQRAKGCRAGKKIIRIRKKFHLSQLEFSKLLGVNMFSVSHWELGKNNPRPAQMAKIMALRSLSRTEVKNRLDALQTAKTADGKTAEKEEQKSE